MTKLNEVLIPLNSAEGQKIVADILGVKPIFNKPAYEMHFAIKAVVWDDGSVTWEHAGEMYESAYPDGVVWDCNKSEWNFYRDDNERMESKCHNQISDMMANMRYWKADQDEA